MSGGVSPSVPPERPIGLVLRTLLALSGLAALAAGFLVGTAEWRSPSLVAYFVGAFCLAVAAGGVLLIRGAARGRIRFRRVRRRATTHD